MWEEVAVCRIPSLSPPTAPRFTKGSGKVREDALKSRPRPHLNCSVSSKCVEGQDTIANVNYWLNDSVAKSLFPSVTFQ